MKRMVVGIIGCNGEIGRGIAGYLLEKNYTVYGIQRRRTDDFKAHENLKQIIMDVSDTEKLKEVASGCDMLINCVAPAYKYSHGIAKTVGKAGIVYLDLTDCIVSDELPENGTYITSCGYIPGLSAVIPKLIVERHFDKVDSAVLFQGGTELCSERALTDIILSSEKSGSIDAYYNNGIVDKLAIDPRKRFSLPVMGDEVFLKAYLSDEMVDFSKRMHINDLKWFNAYEKISHFKFFLKLIGAVFSSDVQKISSFVASERSERVNIDGNLYSAMFGDIIGSKDNREKCVRFVLSFSDMNKICSVSAGAIADKVLHSDIEPGRYFGYPFADEKIIPEIQDCLCGKDFFDISEISVGSSFENIL